jgi:hypothetical protein
LDHGDKLYYVLEESSLDHTPTVQKRLYTGPLMLSSLGRVRLTAFLWRQGFGEGKSTTNIFMLDDEAKPGAPTRVFIPHEKVPPPRPPEKFCKVTFSRLPEVVNSLESFGVELSLVDEAGFPCPSIFPQNKCVVSAEVFGGVETYQTTFEAPKQSHRMRTLHPLPFVQTSNMLVSSKENSHGGFCALGRSGKGGTWNAFADSSPCLSSLITACACVTFRVQCLSRVIVGLHLGLEDVTSELSWRALPISFHFSADLNDPSTVPAFRIYESGKLCEDCGTEEFSIGDEFAIRLRPNGDVAYFHNGMLIFTSTNTISNPSAIFSVHVRVASQLEEIAVSNLALVEDGEPFLASIENILWKPAMPESEASFLVLRAWIAGTDYIPAVARIPLRTNSVPRWAFAAMSLASMFALGVSGSQSSHVAAAMNDNHAKHPALSTTYSLQHDTGSIKQATRTPGKVSVGAGISPHFS